MTKKLVLCKPNGFCAGVDRAIQIVDLALQTYGKPIYVNHEIVHNHHVVNDLAAKGAIFVDDLEEVPEGERLIYSAHGVGPSVREAASSRQLIELDATCPLVTKVHNEAIRFARQGYHVFLIGHADHVEVIGTYGHAPDHITIVEPLRGEALAEHIRDLPQPPTDKLIYLTQTTLNADDCIKVAESLKTRFPTLKPPPTDDICYATTNRQNAVKAIAADMDFFVVVGANISSNSKRLVEVAEESGCPARLFQDVNGLREHDLTGVKSIGLTAGASTPGLLIHEIIGYLNALGYTLETYDHVPENLAFNLPYNLRQDMQEKGIEV